jgi:hypothetical protein
MTTIKRISFAAVLAALLSSCGSGEQSQGFPLPVQDTVFGEMVGTMDKARAVESTMQQHKDALDEAVEEGDRADAQ